MRNTCSTAGEAGEQMPKAEGELPSAASAALQPNSSASTPTVSGPIEVFPNAQHFSINGGTFNISLSSATHSQTVHEQGQSQYSPSPNQTFTAPAIPTPSILTATDSEVYAKLLLPKRHGYPLWIPEPYEGSNPAYPAKGVRVGDVGVVNDDGGFQYLFNVCHPADDPLNGRGVPNGFIPFSLESLEVDRQILRFPVDSHIASSQIERVENSQPVNHASRTNVYSSSAFTSSRSEGAIIVLPKGAHRFDARNLAGLRKYAMCNAVEWYKYVNGRRGWEVPNDALYLVTGCDKCTCWAMTSFCEHTAEGNTLSLELLTVTEREDKHDTSNADERLSSVRYIWKGGSIVASRAGPGSHVPQSGYGSSIPARRQNHCIFLRGYKIAINADESGRAGAENKVVLSSVVDSSPDIIFSKGTHIPFGLDSRMFSGLDAASNPTVERRDAESGGYQDANAEPHITFSMEHVPGRQQASVTSLLLCISDRFFEQPYHPSDVVNRFLLSQNEHIKVAVTHDSEWCSVLDPAAMSMPEDDELLSRVLSAHSVITSPDGAFLEPVIHPDTENSSAVVPVNSPRSSETHMGLSLLSPSPSFLRKSKKATSHTPDTERSSHIPNLVFKPGEWIDMDQNFVVHSGNLILFSPPSESVQLRKAPERDLKGNEWIELYVLLCNHYLLLTEPDERNGIMEYHVICRPIPLDLLTLGSFASLLNLPSIPFDDTPSSSAQFPCQLILIYNGRPDRIFDLHADTAEVQLEWKQKLEEAIATHKATQSNRLFELEILNESTFLTPAPSTQNTDLANDIPENLLIGKVTCSVPFTTADGRTLVAIGCAEGVWIGFRHDPKSMRRVLHLKLVTQCAMLENFGIFLVLADKSLFAYHIEALVPSSFRTNRATQVQAQRLNNGGNIEFFRVGMLNGRTLLIYMKKRGLNSVFRVLEPVGEKINERVKLRGAFGFKLLRPAKSEWFRHYRDFFLASESFDLVFLKKRIAILCTKGFEMMDLNDFKSVTFPQLEDPRSAQLAKRCSSCLPLGMFRSADDEFLLCYSEFGVYVDNHGVPSRAASTIEWEGTAERVALHSLYILLFDSNFIEIRHLETGRLAQIIPGNDVCCIWDGRGVSTNTVVTTHDGQDEPVNQDTQVHAVMNAPDTGPRSRAIIQQVFDLLPPEPLCPPAITLSTGDHSVR